MIKRLLFVILCASTLANQSNGALWSVNSYSGFPEYDTAIRSTFRAALEPTMVVSVFFREFRRPESIVGIKKTNGAYSLFRASALSSIWMSIVKGQSIADLKTQYLERTISTKDAELIVSKFNAALGVASKSEPPMVIDGSSFIFSSRIEGQPEGFGLCFENPGEPDIETLVDLSTRMHAAVAGLCPMDQITINLR